MMQRFFRSSNKWDAATDMLSNKHKLEGMQSNMEGRSINTSTQLNVYFTFQSLNYLVLHTAKESIPTGKEKYETRKR